MNMLERPVPADVRDGISDSSARVNLTGLRILAIMPSVPVRGMERSNLRIMQSLRERGADVLFITERDYGELVVREVERIGCRWTPMSCIDIPHLTKSPREMWRTARTWRRVASHVRRVLRDFRPTHIHVTNVSYFLLAWPALTLQPAPVIFRLPNPPDHSLGPFKQRIWNAIWRQIVAKTADVLVTNCEFTVRELARTGADCRKVRVIRNMLAQPESAAVSDAPVVDPAQVNIAYTSQVNEAKGADLLVEAAFRLIQEGRPVTFYLAGENAWRNPFADALKERVRAAGMEQRIRFLGHIHDVLGLLGRCDLHVQPARREVFPNSVLEAKHCGIPSVVTDAGGLPEIVQHLTDGYVCRRGSGDTVYDGIRYFLDEPDARARCGLAARRSLHRYSPHLIGDEWARLYRELS